MDDLPTQMVDGLAHPAGVQFGFTINGAPDVDATYNSGGPGTTVFVDDPSIEGATGSVLTLNFDAPTDILEFGVAFASDASIAGAAEVELWDTDGVLVSSTSLDANLVLDFPDANFLHQGTPVTTATIDFTPALQANSFRFAFDNLVFRLVPEPATLGAVAFLVAAATGFAARPTDNE